MADPLDTKAELLKLFAERDMFLREARMVRTGHRLWNKHPAVNNHLTIGEKAADWLKHWFGTWTALFGVAASIAIWVLLQKTGIHWDLYPFILLNLCLSCLAAVQGIILQISANRGDKISAQVAVHTESNTDQLKDQSGQILDLQNQQMSILQGQHTILQKVNEIHAHTVGGDDATGPVASPDSTG